MKLTKEDRKLFKETYSKYKLKEGFISNLFLSILSRNLKSDKKSFSVNLKYINTEYNDNNTATLSFNHKDCDGVKIICDIFNI